MRRVCNNCGVEYRDDEANATARVDDQFYIACSGFCLVEQIAGVYPAREVPLFR